MNQKQRMQKVEMYAPRASLSWNCVECLTQKLLVHREREMTVISRHHAGFVSSPIFQNLLLLLPATLEVLT